MSASVPASAHAAILADMLEAAGATLLALPAGSHFRRSLMGRYAGVATILAALPPPGRDVPPPTLAACQDAETMLALFALMPPRAVRLVGARMLIDPVTRKHLFAWRELGRLMGVDHKQAQRWHAEALEDLAARLTARRHRAAA